MTSYTFNNVTADPHHLGHLRRRHQHHHRERRRQRLRHPGRRDGRALERDAGLHDHPGGQPPRLRRARRRRVGRRGDLLHLQQRHREPHHLGHLRRRHQHHHDGSGRQRLHHPVVSQRQLRGQPDLPDRARHPPPRRRRGGRRRVAGSDRVLHLQQRHLGGPHHLGHLRRRHQHHHRERRRQRLRHPGRRDGRALERDAGLHDHPGGQPPRLRRARRRRVGRRGDLLHLRQRHREPHHLGHLRRRHQHHHRERRGQRLRHPGRRDGRALERDAGLHDHPGGQPPRLRRARRRRVGRRGDLLHLQQRHGRPTPSRPPSPSTPTPSRRIRAPTAPSPRRLPASTTGPTRPS